jgi:hypothetical protein
VVGPANGSLTFRAPSKFHRDQVVGRYVSRMETIAGVPIEVLLPGASPAPSIERPPPHTDDHSDRPDLSQIFRAMPPGDDNGTANPPPAPLPPQHAPPASTRRKTSGFTRAELEAGALDAPWPPDRPAAPTGEDPA